MAMYSIACKSTRPSSAHTGGQLDLDFLVKHESYDDDSASPLLDLSVQLHVKPKTCLLSGTWVLLNAEVGRVRGTV
jgi:hypothetical protein